MPVAMAKMLVEDDVLGRKAHCLTGCGALADLDLALVGVGLTCSSKAITTVAAPAAGSAWPGGGFLTPSFIEIELTMPCPAGSRPASITLHLLESIITGTRAMSGRWLIRLKAYHGGSGRAWPVHVDVDDLAPFSTCWCVTASACSYSPLRIRRTLEPVTLALADVDEQRLRRGQRLRPDTIGGGGAGGTDMALTWIFRSR